MQNFIAIKGFSISIIVLIFFKPPVKTSPKSSALGDFDFVCHQAEKSGRNKSRSISAKIDLHIYKLLIRFAESPQALIFRSSLNC